jgi:hypothetical protein
LHVFQTVASYRANTLKDRFSLLLVPFYVITCKIIFAAYLMGCPVRGVILDPMVAMQMGTQGQVSTHYSRFDFYGSSLFTFVICSYFGQTCCHSLYFS